MILLILAVLALLLGKKKAAKYLAAAWLLMTAVSVLLGAGAGLGVIPEIPVLSGGGVLSP